jgi:hypothetical protein
MREETDGWLERRRDSEQPVHSWKCNQMTGGLVLLWAAAATRPCMLSGSPIMAVAVRQTLMNSLRGNSVGNRLLSFAVARFLGLEPFMIFVAAAGDGCIS